jgi:protein-tyrosine phosphatase
MSVSTAIMHAMTITTVHHLAPYEPRLVVGPGPTEAADIDFLAGHGITGLLSLQSDEDLGVRGLSWDLLWRLYTQRGIDAQRVAIRDFDPRDLAAHIPDALAALDRLLAVHARVYLHCTAGINRSATLALAHLYRSFGPERALDVLMERHPSAVPYPDTLSRWWKSARA